TYLVLMTEDGTRLAENDDADDITTNSMITFSLPHDGTYTIVATRFLESEGFAGGNYTLSVSAGEAVPVVETTEEPQQGGEYTLVYNDAGAGTISDENYEDRWTFTGAQGDQISIIMSRNVDELGGLDGYLILEGPDGSKLVEADDSEGSVMPAIENYELPADGIYTIVATRFGFENGFSTGEYSLSLSSGEPPATTEPPTTAATPENSQPITYNSAVSGTISAENFEDWYTFEGSAGDGLTIHMNASSGDLDTYLSLTDGNGVDLASNDDSENAGESLIENFELPADGTYLIRATRYGYANGPSSGDYTLIIETDAEAVTPPVSTGGTANELTPGVPVSGSLDPEHTAASYTFSGSAGEIVTIGAYSVMGNGSLLLSLKGPDGVEIATNPVGNDPYRSYIFNMPLAADGTYVIDMQLQDSTTASDYKLIVVKHNPVELSGGSFTPTPGVEIEVVLIWATSADLDLQITGPDELSRATTIETANDLCQQIVSVPIERYTWQEGRPGSYQIHVTYNFNCTGGPSSVAFMLAVVDRGQVVALFSGTLAQEGDTYSTQLNFRD
ncbi:MAG TPA: PPC domain-containing protein, partial [Aggregatilineaceae bacterium]|nr:PPC domain-containing protein [Aggregatilineaceae bacterium]